MEEALKAIVFPGVKSVQTASANFPPISDETMEDVSALYNERIRPLVHHRW